MATKNLIVGAVQCPQCLDIIISRHHYDCHDCSCGKTMIDGGREYMRVGFDKIPPHHLLVEIIGLTASELRQDSMKHLGITKTKNLVYNILYRYTLNKKGKLYRYPKTTRGKHE